MNATQISDFLNPLRGQKTAAARPQTWRPKAPPAFIAAPDSAGLMAPATKNKTYAKRAKAKFLSFQLAKSLAELNSPMKQKYINTLHCGNDIIQRGDKLTSKYCGNRWCLVCNRIRTGKLINKYLDLSAYLKGSVFVTLTVKNIKAVNIEDEQERRETMRDLRFMQRRMFRHFAKIQDMLRKNGVKLKGIRSYECIPARTFDGVRPHIHWKIDDTITTEQVERIWSNNKLPVSRLIDLFIQLEKKQITLGELKGQLIIELWLKEFPNADRKGQDVRRCHGKTERELFKYETKFQVWNKKEKCKTIPLRLIDIIYEASINLRAVQITGFLMRAPKPAKDIFDEDRYAAQLQEYTLYKTLTHSLEQTDINDGLEAETVEDLAPVNAVFQWRENNWYEISSSQPLCKYLPDKKESRFIESFAYS